MHDPAKLDSFGKERAKQYDQSNRHMAPINETLHYLIKVILSELAPHSTILCVGVGTGNEIIELAKAFPTFTFVAVDPSESMIEVCKDKLQNLNLLDRCKLIPGYIEDVPESIEFDAALCLLVLHHASPDQKTKIISGIANRLRATGYFIWAEISYDMNASGDILEKWKSMILKSGAPVEKVQNLPQLMKDHLFIQTPSEVESMVLTHGLSTPIQFFQALLIRAWYARK